MKNLSVLVSADSWDLLLALAKGEFIDDRTTWYGENSVLGDPRLTQSLNRRIALEVLINGEPSEDSLNRVNTVKVIDAPLGEYAFVAKKFKHLSSAQYRRDYYEATTGIPCGIDDTYLNK